MTIPNIKSLGPGTYGLCSFFEAMELWNKQLRLCLGLLSVQNWFEDGNTEMIQGGYDTVPFLFAYFFSLNNKETVSVSCFLLGGGRIDRTDDMTWVLFEDVWFLKFTGCFKLTLTPTLLMVGQPTTKRIPFRNTAFVAGHNGGNQWLKNP